MLSPVDCWIRELLQDIGIVNHKDPCRNPQYPHISFHTQARAHARTPTVKRCRGDKCGGGFDQHTSLNCCKIISYTSFCLLVSPLTLPHRICVIHLRASAAPCTSRSVCHDFCCCCCCLWLVALAALDIYYPLHPLLSPLVPSSGPSAFSNDKVFVAETTGEAPSWWYLARLSFDTTLGPHSA